MIDPLDGTVNYLYGLHDWAVSIAAEVGWAEGGEVAGAVRGRAERAGEMFTATRRGRGAWPAAVPGWAGCRGRPARHCGCRARACRLTRRWSATGSGTWRRGAQVQGEVVAALLPRVRDIRRIGVASVDLCAVAAGRLDGFYERGLNYWDWAAGALVAAEAGAVVGGLHGAPGLAAR